MINYINKNPVIQFLFQFFGPLVCIGAMTLFLRIFEPILEVQYVALLFLLPVMISTALWGLTPGILAGFVSFIVFNYFFIQPYNTLLVHKTQDLITLTIFLIVAVVMSQLIGQAKKGSKMAQMREWEATRMYELIAALAGLSEMQAIAQTLCEHLMRTFKFDRVEIVVNGRSAEQSISFFMPDQNPFNVFPATCLSMMTHRNTEGEMRLWYAQNSLTDAENRLLEAFSNQGALAIERVHLTEGENKIRVLEESDRIKTSLLNSVSHELRSPLAAIKASISSLRSGAVDWNNEARVELLTTVEEETDKLNLLVGNLLDMSRIESGALKPLERWNSIAEIAMGITAKMRAQLKEHKLEFDLPADLPLVPTDYVLMEQVFTNLISNSVKYAPVNTRILISAFPKSGMLQVMVENQSPRVKDEYLEHIFDKFFRVTDADKVIGTGLGLSICKGIIEAHGGEIWAENLPMGFRFVFTLPLTLYGSLPAVPKED
jgi:two-component system, OmpR family, sensor histidine kinase KdpD